MATVSKSKYDPVSSVSSSSGISSRPIGQEEETKEQLPGEIPPATAAAVNNDLESNISPGTSQGPSSQESEDARIADAHKRVQQGLPHEHKRYSRWGSWKWDSWRSQPPKESVGQKVLYCGLGFCQLIVLIAVFVFVIVLIVLLVSYLTPKKHKSKPKTTTTTDDTPPPAPTDLAPTAMIMEFLINEVFDC
jgi:hypothetical protein